MPKSREDFMGDSGGFLDGVHGRTIDATFEVASGKYADQAMLGGGSAPVVITITVESPDLEKPASQSYSVGGQDLWEITRDGKEIINKKDPEKHVFRTGSRAFALVSGMAVAVGRSMVDKPDEMAVKDLEAEGQKLFVERDFYMTEAEFYEGLDFDWETQLIEQEIKEKSGNIKTVKSTVPLPHYYYGSEAKVEQKPASGGKGKGKGKEVSAEEAELDQILIDNAAGKTERELKSFAVRNEKIRGNDEYMHKITGGEKIPELETAGKLIKDGDKYL